jgi:hypothetical protein
MGRYARRERTMNIAQVTMALQEGKRVSRKGSHITNAVYFLLRNGKRMDLFCESPAYEVMPITLSWKDFMATNWKIVAPVQA